MDLTYYRLMAAYNRWMTGNIHAVCDGIPDEERKRDRGAFFGSIHRTLDHILYGDLNLLSRLTGDPPEMPKLGVTLYDDYDDLQAERSRVADRIVGWSERLTESWLNEPHTFTSQTSGITQVVPQWVIVVHLFNHQIHHRGQLTTLLSQLGYDPGPTDLHRLPNLGDILRS